MSDKILEGLKELGKIAVGLAIAAWLFTSCVYDLGISFSSSPPDADEVCVRLNEGDSLRSIAGDYAAAGVEPEQAAEHSLTAIQDNCPEILPSVVAEIEREGWGPPQ